MVRMLENRSFDHLFGYLKATNSKEKLIPVICQFKPIRDKHTAHRSIDCPRREDTVHLQQAWALSSLGGLIFWPKDDKLEESSLLDQFLNPKRLWMDNYWAFQMRTTPGTVIDFSMKAEHPKIIAETFGLLEKLVT